MSTRVATGEPPEQGFNHDPLAQFSRLFCRFLQVVFSGFPKGQYHWSEDEKLTDITISDQSTISKEVVGRRPAILVARGPSQFTNTSMNQLAGPVVGYSGTGTIQQPGGVSLAVNPTTGEERHTDLIAATMQYNCLSSEGIEAGRIAWACGYFTRTLKTSLMRAGLHRVGEDVSFGAESAPGTIVQPDTNEIIMVSVSVPFFFQDTYTLGPKYKVLLNEVDLALASGIDSSSPESPALKPPSIYGNVQNGNLVPLGSRVVAETQAPFKRPKPLKGAF